MIKAPIPKNEKERLEALREFGILDTLPSQQFDDLTVLASHICGVPTALISLIDESRQWFKSRVNLDATETHRDVAFCAHAILQDEIFEVPDPLDDERFHDNPLVISGPKIRFYAGAPLIIAGGHRLGTLCVIDQTPGRLGDEQKRALTALARQVVAQIELRKKVIDLGKARTQLFRSEKEARHASHTKSEFLANMSHEIRTPMSGIVGMTDLLLDSPLDGEQAEKLKVIQSCASSLLTLINDILDFSKLEAGKVRLESLPFSPTDLLEETVRLFHPVARAKDLCLTFESGTDLPEQVLGDVHRVRQIFNNLVSNAIKFTQTGSIHISLGSDTKVNGRPGLRIAVRDTGIGISSQDQQALFRSFSQVDASTTRKFGGTGLGLAISKGLCEMMGGEMHVESEAGKGSTFTFTFVADPTGAPKVADTLSGQEGLKRGPRLPILVAEDNPMNQKVIAAFLQKLGYEAEVVENGRLAYERAKQNRYSLILMDCQMPEMDGYEATARIISEVPDDIRPPIVAITADAFAEDRKRCLEAGMTDFLAKPFKIMELNELLERLCDPADCAHLIPRRENAA